MTLSSVFIPNPVEKPHQQKSTAKVTAEKGSQDIKAWQLWITDVSALNFRLREEKYKGKTPDGHSVAESWVGSGSISVAADIRSCRDNNLQETHVSMSVHHLITNTKQHHNFLRYLLTCVAIFF